MTSTRLRFTKMHGAGNDFIVLDGISQDLSKITKSQWQALANRQLGIGADQILLVEKPTAAEAEFRYRIFNSDGGEVEQCGNGSRCFVRFVREKGLTKNKTVKVQVAHTILSLTENDDGQVTVNMGAPILLAEQVPFNAAHLKSKTEGAATLYELNLTGGSIWLNPISMGNPHAVQIVDNINTAPVELNGPEIESHVTFPKKVNAGFMQIQNRHEIKLRVFERGSGETLACGTGACAAVVSGILRGQLDSPVKVHTRGGDLTIAWDHQASLESPVMMTGPAQTVFEGEITLE
ncbi:diaminopimelate epimerase [Polynucleobacter sp. 30F-ANTBAC]|jgi:diaminopimelate epimerase|uniref:diaminopimelate epimerase n=1 Tax=Polynucleobacter sp. 30F-ANTBAC TaxID=2689095 RepID=UPI001C0E1920|nr:diaminopimelate epimerase [Polynucleobacter sp. 30F-ANTBAC]MBU3600080.1 diaminopimelate epimerase [Polynucleobacter sp. 30F-ANTBAC]